MRKLTSGSSTANPDPGAEPDCQIPRLTVVRYTLEWFWGASYIVAEISAFAEEDTIKLNLVEASAVLITPTIQHKVNLSIICFSCRKIIYSIVIVSKHFTARNVSAQKKRGQNSFV